jgi:hypothetical protein
MKPLRLGAPGRERPAVLTDERIVEAFGIPELVRYVSNFTVLHPGDLIDTGIPAGAGLASTEASFVTGTARGVDGGMNGLRLPR